MVDAGKDLDLDCPVTEPDPRPEARLGAAMKAARELRERSRRAFASRLHMSHSNLADYENGHRLAPAHVVEAYERELELPRGSLLGQWERARTQLYGELRDRRPRWVPPLGQPPPRELPRPIADFTGRREERAALRRLLLSGEPGASSMGHPVVVSAVDGMGGIGKSALAIQVAHELVDAGQFPDGQLYVNLQGATPGLAPLDPLEALSRMLRALGVEAARIPNEASEAAAHFRSRAANRRLLVVLDDAATAEQVRPLLPASPTCGVVITSRNVLATLEGILLLHLDVLVPDQALQLLGRIVGPERIGAHPEGAAELVRYCGYLPLAIRIAGARLAARPGWEMGAVATRLADTTRRLEELETGGLAVRSSFDVSREALEHSGDPLDQAAVAVFGLLSLPDGPDIGLAAAARLLDEPEHGAQRLLERLVDAQLLETPRLDRYRFHDLVRLYAREHAQRIHPEPERTAALTRLLIFYAATARRTLMLLRPGDPRAGAADPRWTQGGIDFAEASAGLAWWEAERANVLAALSQAAATGPEVLAELACQLPRALFGIFYVGGYWQDGLQANRIALELARCTQDLAAQAHTDLGLFSWLLGRHAEAITCHRDSLAIYREMGNRHGEANSLNNLGLVYEWMGRHAEAMTCHQDSVAIFRELGDRRGEAYSLNNLGFSHRSLGRYGQATAYCQDSLALLRQVGDRHNEAYTLHSLGMTYRSLQSHAEAIAHHQASLAIFRELGDRRGEAYNLTNVGLVYFQQGRYPETVAHHQASLAIFRELGDRYGEATSLNNLGVVNGELGRRAEAIACYEKSLTIRRELGDRQGQAETLGNLGDALKAMGHHQRAEVVWQEALTISEALGIPEAAGIRTRLVTLTAEDFERPSSE